MNKEEILAMEAGKVLNLLVAEKVIGLIAWQEKRGEYTHIVFQKPDDSEPYRKSRNWEKEMDRYKRIEYSEINSHIHVVQDIKAYSSDISAAWEVFTKFDLPSVSMWTDPDDNEWFTCNIGINHVIAKTAQEAICKAALLAVMDS